MNIEFKILNPFLDRIYVEGVTPGHATEHSAGIDMYAMFPPDDTTRWVIPPNGQVVIPTGMAISIPEGYVGLACPRSGLAFKHSITLTNGPGVIDSDYRGEIMGIMFNHGEEPVYIEPGDRIFQLVVVPYVHVQLTKVDELPDTVRGDGGFGSTGK